jgi:hypothetical protein
MTSAWWETEALRRLNTSGGAPGGGGPGETWGGYVADAAAAGATFAAAFAP